MNEENIKDEILFDDRIHARINDRHTLDFVSKEKYDSLLRRIKEAVEEMESLLPYVCDDYYEGYYNGIEDGVNAIIRCVPEAKEAQDDTD